MSAVAQVSVRDACREAGFKNARHFSSYFGREFKKLTDAEIMALLANHCRCIEVTGMGSREFGEHYGRRFVDLSLEKIAAIVGGATIVEGSMWNAVFEEKPDLVPPPGKGGVGWRKWRADTDAEIKRWNDGGRIGPCRVAPLGR